MSCGLETLEQDPGPVKRAPHHDREAADVMEGQAAKPEVRRRDADPHPGSDRVPHLISVGELDRLGWPSRPRGVDHAVDGVGLGGLVELDIGRGRRFERLGRIAEHEARLESLEEAVALAVRQARVHGSSDGAELHQRVQQHDVVRGGLECQRDAILAAHAEPRQPASRLAGAAVELAVGDGLVARDQRDVLGHGLRGR